MLQHVHQFLDDLHAVGVLKREPHQCRLRVRARSPILRREQPHKRTDPLGLSDRQSILLGLCEREESSRRLLLRLPSARAIKQCNEMRDRTGLGDGTLSLHVPFAQPRQRGGGEALVPIPLTA